MVLTNNNNYWMKKWLEEPFPVIAPAVPEFLAALASLLAEHLPPVPGGIPPGLDCLAARFPRIFAGLLPVPTGVGPGVVTELAGIGAGLAGLFPGFGPKLPPIARPRPLAKCTAQRQHRQNQ